MRPSPPLDGIGAVVGASGECHVVSGHQAGAFGTQSGKDVLAIPHADREAGEESGYRHWPTKSLVSTSWS